VRTILALPVATLVAALLLVACAPKAKPAVPYDLLFIDAMVAHHQGAIAMAQPVELQATHPELKDFARMVVEGQSREIEAMMQWRDQWFPGQPKAPDILAMPGMTRTMLDEAPGHLWMLSGGEFDRMFINMMIPHHEGGITMAKDALAKSNRPEIKDLAQRIIDTQQSEIQMMKRWKSEWAKAR